MDFFTGPANPANPAVNPASTQVPPPRPTRLPPMSQPRSLTPFNTNPSPEPEPRENYQSYSPPGQNNRLNTSIAFPRPRRSWWPFGRNNTNKNKVPKLQATTIRHYKQTQKNNLKGLRRKNYIKEKVYNMKNTNTNRVEYFRKNPVSVGINKKGYVLGQKNTNKLENIRSDVREQNLIKEACEYAATILGLKNKNRKIINFKDITIALRDKNISEEDAIYIYNLLILLLLILFVYIAEYIKTNVSEATAGLSTKENFNRMRNNSVNPTNNIIQQKILNEYTQRSIIDKTTNVLGEMALLSITILSTAAATYVGTSFAPWTFFRSLLIIPIPINLYIRHLSKYESIKTYIKKSVNIRQIILIIMNLLLSEKNTIPMKNIKDKLKFWGLTKDQIYYLVNNNTTFGRLSKIDTSNEEELEKILLEFNSEENFERGLNEFLSAINFPLRPEDIPFKNPGNKAPNEMLSSYVPDIHLQIISDGTVKNTHTEDIAVKGEVEGEREPLLGGYRKTKKVNKNKKTNRNSRKL